MLKLTYVRAILLSFPWGTWTTPEGPWSILSLFLISMHMVSMCNVIITRNRIASRMQFYLSPSTSMFIGFIDSLESYSVSQTQRISGSAFLQIITQQVREIKHHSQDYVTSPYQVQRPGCLTPHATFGPLNCLDKESHCQWDDGHLLIPREVALMSELLRGVVEASLSSPSSAMGIILPLSIFKELKKKKDRVCFPDS